jgi:hypothetical protein
MNAQGLTGTPDINVGIVTSTISIPTQLRTRSVAEKTTLVPGNTVGTLFQYWWWKYCSLHKSFWRYYFKCNWHSNG